MQMRRHSGNAAWENFAAFSHKFLEQVWILVVDGFCGNIDASTRHNPVGPSEVRSAFGVFRFHLLTSPPDEGYVGVEKDCTFSSPTGQVYSGFFCCPC